MLPADAVARTQALEIIRKVVAATGEVTGHRGEHLARIEALFAPGTKKKPASAPRAGKAG